MRPARSSSALKGADVVFTGVVLRWPYAGHMGGFHGVSQIGKYFFKVTEGRCFRERQPGFGWASNLPA